MKTLRTIPLTLAVLCAISSVKAQTAGTQLVINEICAANVDQWVDPSFNYGGWLEFYNPTSSAISITGWRISDDPDNLRKGKITQSTTVPAKGYKTVWFDSYHPRYSPKTIDMKLDVDGGTIYVSDAAGNLLLTQTYPIAVARCSWARTTDGGSDWKYCANPSQEFSNDGRKYAMERLSAPEIDCESVVYKTGIASFNVTIPEGCTLRYTTDGSAPTLTNGSTSTNGKFSPTTTQLYRFRLFRDGYLPSAVVAHSCIRSSLSFGLPILSISSTYKNFYSDSIGIFTKGRMNGRPGRGSADKCNWNMDWERPAVFEYYTKDGELLFAQEAGIERCGGWSRAWEPWSFKIRGDKKYEGKKTLDYPFFADKPYIKSRALQVRNGGNDNWCRVRDPFLQQIVLSSGLNVDCQAYQPVAHFVNGVWKGTINLREPNNKDFVYANYGYDKEEIDQFEMSPDSGYVQVCGDNVAWKRLIALSKQVSSTQGTYEKMCELLDIEAFCNYMAVELYLQNWDWPQNNVKAWRPRQDEGGRYRFTLFDLDGFDGTSTAFTTFAGKQTYTFDYCYDVQKRFTKEIELVTLFTNLLGHSEFRKQFIDAFCLVAYSVFEPTRCKTMINDMANAVAPTQSLFNGGSPWDTANKLISALSSSRQSQMMTQLRNYSKMQLTSKTSSSANICANIEEARLTFNGKPIPLNKFNGRFYGPLIVTASAPAGYEFVGWKQLNSQNKTLLSTNATWRYYDKGSLDNTGWYKSSYNDASWASGAAPLGYFTDGTRDYKTTLSYGGNTQNKRPTYYFRTTVHLDAAPLAGDVMTLNYSVDDGVVIYVNGTEAARYNMPSGNVGYSTFASTYASGNPDKGSMTLPTSLFKAGDNVIAVELHNNSANSTDVYWSASLEHATVSGGEIVSLDAEYKVPETFSNQLIACFEPSAAAASLPPVVINEVSAGNSVYVNEYNKRNDWVELYNTTDQAIDLTGMYLTDRVNKPEKYRITAESSAASAIIPAHGYKLVWCDKLDTDRELHASFKLDNDDQLRQVMLSAADGSWHDTLSYYQHAGTESVGRYPDGSCNVYLMTRPSIAKTNELTLLSSVIEQPRPQAIEQVTEEMTDDEYYVYDLAGRLITRGQGSFREYLPEHGIYIVRSGTSTIKVQIP